MAENLNTNSQLQSQFSPRICTTLKKKIHANSNKDGHFNSLVSTGDIG